MLLLLIKVRPELEGKSQQTFSTFIAVKCKTQVVAGLNYYIKVLTYTMSCTIVTRSTTIPVHIVAISKCKSAYKCTNV